MQCFIPQDNPNVLEYTMFHPTSSDRREHTMQNTSSKPFPLRTCMWCDHWRVMWHTPPPLPHIFPRFLIMFQNSCYYPVYPRHTITSERTIYNISSYALHYNFAEHEQHTIASVGKQETMFPGHIGLGWDVSWVHNVSS